MKALTLEQKSDSLKLHFIEVPKPEIGPHEVLIRVLACGLCHHDKLIIEGTLRRGIVSPLILGHEICGDVESIGSEVTLISPGQRVVPLLTEACGNCERCLSGIEHRCLVGKGFGHSINGGFSTYMKAKETALVAISKDIPPEQACLLSCPIGVGLQAVKNVGKISKNESVMVTGASGGLGVHVLQIAKYLGAKTIAVTSSERKLVSLIELGADEVVSLEEFDYVEIIRAMTAEKGVEAIIDTVGSPLFPSSMRALAQFGRLILLGDVKAGKTTLDLAEILFQDSAILSSTGTQRSNVQEAEYLVRTGSIKPIVHTTLPLKDALIGLGWMSDRRLFGRVVLLPD